MTKKPAKGRRVAIEHDWLGAFAFGGLTVGQWILELSLYCIVCWMVFSQLGVVALMISTFTSIDATAMNQYLPAIGWIIGFVIGIFRIVTQLPKLILQRSDAKGTDDTEDLDSQADSELTGADNDKSVKQSPAFFRPAGIGALLGLVAGIVLSLMLIIVCTAGILSPLAPNSWRAGFRVEQLDDDFGNQTLHDPHQDDGASMGASFWHPIFGSILMWTVPTCAILGASICVASANSDKGTQ